MASARRTRTLAVAQQELWDLIADPHHMPRWWPGVERMEGVEDSRWTQVLKTRKGRPVRADFRLLTSEAPWQRSWEQEIPGTPFERVLNEAITEISLEPAPGGGTAITIAQEQKLRGYSRTGGLMMRGAIKKKLDEALDGLERVCG